MGHKCNKAINNVQDKIKYKKKGIRIKRVGMQDSLDRLDVISRC